MNVLWIGTGIMGAPMCLNLSKKYKITAYNRTLSKAKKLEPFVNATDNLQQAIKDADVIFTIVGYPDDVKQVYSEVFKYAKVGTICIDMTTSSPELAKDLYEKGAPIGIKLLDAPVTGGDLGAINATLSIMVGGDKDTFDFVYDMLSLLGTSINYMGIAGNGQFTKLSNQIAIAGTLLGVAESLTYAKNKDLDLETVYKVLTNGSAASTQFKVNGLKMINEDFNPGFYVKHFLKDLLIAKETIQKSLPVLEIAIEKLTSLVENQQGNLGTQAIIKKYEE